MKARDLRIGQRFMLASQHPSAGERITRLHELCERDRSPHVHVVTTHGAGCLDFDAQT